MKKSKSLRRLALPLLVIMVSAVGRALVSAYAQQSHGFVVSRALDAGVRVLGVLIWLAGAWLAIRVLDVLVWEMLEGRRAGGAVPKLLKDVVAFIVLLVAVMGMLGRVFNLPVTGLLATSGALGLMIGFALRDLITDIIAGIAINIEQPFKIGDWVMVENGTVGEVVEINWRTTAIMPLTRVMNIIPNGKISAMHVRNFSRPQEPFRWHVEFYLDFDVPTERALRVITAAAKSIETDDTMPAVVFMDDIDEIGVKYRVMFWSAGYTDLNPTRTKLIAAVMRNLYHAGITPVHQKRDLFVAPMPARQLSEHKDIHTLLRRCDLFEPLTDRELEQLAGDLDRHAIHTGHEVVSQGDSGNSLFLVVEGLMEVLRRADGGGADISVARIGAGQYFGEFSLLTGEDRSATVVSLTDCVIYEIRKQDIAPLLKSRPDLAEILSARLASRRMQADRAMSRGATAIPDDEKQTLSQQFFKKMSAFFSF